MRILLSLLLGCVATAKETRFTFERGLMGTRFAITCHGSDESVAKAAADLAFQRAEEINAIASDYIAGSELLRLSEKIGTPVKVSPLLFDLLTKSHDFARRTAGCFDPTLGPFTRLWRETRRVGKLPLPEALTTAKSACGWKLLELDPFDQTVTLKNPGMRLDLGGIAKGYAADAMFDVMKSKGFPATCIAAGGDLRLGDPPPGKTGWTVGIKTLDKGKTSGQVELANCAVSTSGDLQQAVEIDGVRYAHIIDPKTGLGLTRHLAVTIIAPDATTSDALATAACVVGPAEAEAMAKACGASQVRIAAAP
jgi:FAD:protein FMN transferase